MLRLLVVCIFISVVVKKAWAWTCWLPDSTSFDNVGMIPCNSTLADTTAGSACCNPRDACTTNGMCLGESGYTYRGGCTDQAFNSNNCPSYCLTDPILNTRYSKNANLYSCGDAGLFTTSFCCGSYANPTQDCCGSSFNYPGSGSAFRPGWDAESLLLAAANNSIVTVTAAVATSTATVTAGATCPSSKSNIGTAVGVGVGVPLGVAAIGFLTFLFWRDRSHKAKQNNIIEIQKGGQSPGRAQQYNYGREPETTASEAPIDAWHPPSELHASD